MVPENSDHHNVDSGASASKGGVAGGERSQAAGRDIYNHPFGDNSSTTIAVVAIVVVALVVVSIVVIILSTPENGPIPTSTPIDTLTPTATVTGTPTSMPTATPSPDPTYQAVLNLMEHINRFIRLELKGNHYTDVDEKMWCQEDAVDELRKYIELEGKQQGIFFAYHENPVMGEDSCLRLWSKYTEGVGMEEDGISVCAAERWAYLPQEVKKPVSAYVRVSTCYFEITDNSICLQGCKQHTIWRVDHENQWNKISTDEMWPTPPP